MSFFKQKLNHISKYFQINMIQHIFFSLINLKTFSFIINFVIQTKIKGPISMISLLFLSKRRRRHRNSKRIAHIKAQTKQTLFRWKRTSENVKRNYRVSQS